MTTLIHHEDSARVPWVLTAQHPRPIMTTKHRPIHIDFATAAASMTVLRRNSRSARPQAHVGARNPHLQVVVCFTNPFEVRTASGYWAD